MSRTLILTLVFICPLTSGTGYCQPAQHQETQSIEPPPFRSPDEKKPNPALVIGSIFDRTNDFREKQGRPGVVKSSALMETAQYFADYMARTDRYGHRADDLNPGDRATRRGYEFSLISENIAYAFDSKGFEADELAKQLEDGWEKSPGHRANILDPDVTEAGMAVARSEKTGYYYAVQMFGRPKSDSVRFEIVNRSTTTIMYKVATQVFNLPPRSTRYHEQGCPVELTFKLPTGGEPVAKSFKGENKARFVIVDEGDNVKITRD